MQSSLQCKVGTCSLPRGASPQIRSGLCVLSAPLSDHHPQSGVDSRLCLAGQSTHRDEQTVRETEREEEEVSGGKKVGRMKGGGMGEWGTDTDLKAKIEGQLDT